MASEKISALGALGGAPAVGDLIPMVDISDTTMAASGTTKRMTVQNLIDAVPRIQGSGTVNRVSKFTAANTIGDSQIFDDGIGIGIGYLSPTANQVSIATYTAIGHNTDSFASLQTRSIGGDDSFRAENLVGDLGFVVKGNNRVSVGFNNPTSRLYVLGEGTTSATTGFRVDDAMGVATLFVRDDRRVGVGTDTPTALLDARRNSATGTESVLIARGSSTTGIQVLDTGHVGIKGAAANTNWSLTIGDSGSQHTRFVGGGQDLVRVGQPAGGTGRIAILTGGNEKIVMSAAAGANAMVINSGGNTSTTTAFNIINSSSASLFSVRDDGRVSLDSTTGALLLSRMTTAQRDAMTAADGMIIYNTTTNAFNFRENGAWVTGSGLA